ncbi:MULTISPECIES: cytochrome b/b6 domain-containing protein [Shewanella]|uniref:Cytochrome b/b6 domain-containing protein n=1 Tax=Shewanella polaris TaxID=2588449 RepID=A0A4Y5YI22_9GAMM|nr:MULTISPECIES: cytochrome b/b6 domain-containing protein [Shewanella]QDE32317.1 cytochrome b/b6 domain-containing protein [Shewanella polaris]
MVKQLWQCIEVRLHQLVILMSLLLICTSPWIFIGRQLSPRAGFWDVFHVYGGLFTGVLALLFTFHICSAGQWRQFFPWLTLDVKPLLNDLRGLTRGKLPHSGSNGLISVIEGLGVIVLLLVALSGAIWYVADPSNALMWRSYHILFAQVFIGFIVIHFILAIVHIRDLF